MIPNRILSHITIWIGLILMLALCVRPSSAQAEDIKLSELSIVNLLEKLAYFEESTGPSEETTTLAFTVVNDTTHEIFWHFRTEVLNPLSFAIYVDNLEVPVLRSPFKSRTQKSHASQGPVLSSDLIAMAPGERIDVRAVFDARPGPTLFPISLLSKDEYDTQEHRRLLSHGLFLGAIMTFVVLFIVSPNFLMNAASNWFGVYLASMALLNMHSHGYSLDFLSITPDNYFLFTRILHTSVMLFYLLFTLSFLKASDAYPTFRRSVWAFIGVGLTIALLEQLLYSDQFQIIANLVPLTFLILGCWGAFLAVRDRLHGGRFFMCGFSLLAIGGVINFFASLPEFARWNEPIDQLTLVLQIADALVFGGAILNQIYGLSHARDQAVTAQLTETQRRLALSKELLSKESDLRKATHLAERHRANLASTSHDLRQPIASLRTSLEIAKDQSPKLVSDLSAGIEFLDELLEQTLAKTQPIVQAQDTSDQPEKEEAVELQIILQNAQRMFAMEAKEKGVSLKIVASSLTVCVPTIDLVRIVSNLASNAVRYAPSGTVLIGVRRRGGGAAIEVWDNGAGIPQEQLETVLQPYVRGPKASMSEGSGLGLTIVQELAERNGLTLNVRSAPGKGSVFAVEGLIIA